MQAAPRTATRPKRLPRLRMWAFLAPFTGKARWAPPALALLLHSLAPGAAAQAPGAPAPAPTAAPATAAEDKPIAVLLSEQKWPEALAAIDRLLKSRPSDTQLLMNRGAVLTNMNRNADALATFERVIRLNPQLPAAHNNMAVILAATGRFDEARAALERAIKAQPNYATAYENLGDLFAHQAHEAYRQALNIDKTQRSAKTKLDMTQQLIIVATGAPPQERPAAPSAGGTTPTAATAAAPAAPTATATAANSPAQAEVDAAIWRWARAWSRRDAEGYTAAYAPDYQGTAGDPAKWRRDMQSRLEARSRIQVDISELEITVDGDKATARFLQTYESDQAGSRMRTRKSLVFQKIQNRWLIVDEQRR